MWVCFYFFQDTGSMQLIYGIINVGMVLNIFLITIVISPVTQEVLRTAFSVPKYMGFTIFLLIIIIDLSRIALWSFFILYIWSVSSCIYNIHLNVIT